MTQPWEARSPAQGRAAQTGVQCSGPMCTRRCPSFKEPQQHLQAPTFENEPPPATLVPHTLHSTFLGSSGPPPTPDSAQAQHGYSSTQVHFPQGSRETYRFPPRPKASGGPASCSSVKGSRARPERDPPRSFPKAWGDRHGAGALPGLQTHLSCVAPTMLWPQRLLSLKEDRQLPDTLDEPSTQKAWPPPPPLQADGCHAPPRPRTQVTPLALYVSRCSWIVTAADTRTSLLLRSCIQIHELRLMPGPGPTSV